MRSVAKRLEGEVEFPLLVQGTRSKSYLLQRFKQSGNAVLLGTSSFWEGVDVRGEALSCVIIDKLPFEAPNDPVLKARLKVMEQSGDNPFSKHQLPEAVISLRQGVGRLIRDSQDRGVLMICDPRLLKRSYGRVFLDSLPSMARTRDIEDVRDFFKQDDSL
jgi:ATP-dependent DNA helicase DinG